MDLRRQLLHLDLPDRIALDTAKGRLFINFEKMRVRSLEDVADIRAQVEKVCGPLDGKVDVVVNYDGFRLEDDVASAYAEMVADLENRFYNRVTRYSGSAFMRLKLGKTIEGSGAHIFETSEAAQAFLDRQT
jgi:propionate CoA-transferase